jgi:putative peptide zinc metalloprotease protein
MLGHVLTQESLVLRVAVAEEEAPLIAARVKSIEARLAGTIEQALHAALVRDAVGATTSLPSAALSTRHGGTILTDPDDKDALKPLAPIVLMDVLLAQRVHDRFGERAWVRFDHGAAPLAQQWVRRARQVLLRQFNPAT